MLFRSRPRTRMRRRAKPSWCDWGLGRRPSVETSRQRRRRRFPLSVFHVTPPGPPAGAEGPILRFRGGGGDTGLTASTQSRGGLQKTVTRNAAVAISAKVPPTQPQALPSPQKSPRPVQRHQSLPPGGRMGPSVPPAAAEPGTGPVALHRPGSGALVAEHLAHPESQWDVESLRMVS